MCVVAIGVLAARDALLTFMVGGNKFDEAKKVLENMGKNIIHCGPVGTGQVRNVAVCFTKRDWTCRHWTGS